MEPEELLDGRPVATSVFERVRSGVAAFGPFDVRTTASQIALRRTRGFAYVWLPGRYLENPGAEVVLTIALGRHDPSARFKEVAHPSSKHWMHHLEIHSPDEIDDQVLSWLREAYERAG